MKQQYSRQCELRDHCSLYLIVLRVNGVSATELFIARLLPPTRIDERTKYIPQHKARNQSSDIFNYKHWAGRHGFWGWPVHPQIARASLLTLFPLILLGNQRPIHQLVSDAVVIHVLRNSSKLKIHVIHVPTLLPVDLVYGPECFRLAFSLMGFIYSLPQFPLQSFQHWFDNLKALRGSLASYKFSHLSTFLLINHTTNPQQTTPRNFSASLHHCLRVTVTVRVGVRARIRDRVTLMDRARVSVSCGCGSRYQSAAQNSVCSKNHPGRQLTV